MRYCIYDNTGRILKFGVAHEDMLPLLEQEGTVMDIGEAYCDDSRQYVENGQLVDMPPRPGPTYDFDYALKQWVDPRTLEQRKAAQWEAIKQARANAEYGGFVWDGSPFDSDAASQQKIIGASQWASINPNIEIDWTLADNTVRTLTAAQMQQVGQALGAHVDGVYAKARTLRQQIEAATTPAEVEAVQW